MIKKLICGLIIVLLLASCTPAVAKTVTQTIELTPKQTTLSAELTQQPGGTAFPGPTEIFITQVMATKYAARTEYAALPTITPTPTIPPGSPDCAPSDLLTTFHSNGATGRIVLEVGVTNTGISPCFLPSWPVVELLDRSGKALEIAYDFIYPDANPSILPPTQESNPGDPLVYGMEANQTAGLALLWGNWCQGTVAGGVVIRIFLLETGSWIDVPTDIEGGGHCDEATFPSTVDVVGFGY